jgi:hypothetical protein
LGTVLANAERLMLSAAALVMKPPGEVDYLRWAVQNIVLTARESAFPGP